MDFSLTPITPTVISSILMAVQEMTLYTRYLEYKLALEKK